MASFKQFLEHRDPELYDEIDWKGWAGKAGNLARGVFNTAKDVARGAAGTASDAGNLIAKGIGAVNKLNTPLVWDSEKGKFVPKSKSGLAQQTPPPLPSQKSTKQTPPPIPSQQTLDTDDNFEPEFDELSSEEEAEKQRFYNSYTNLYKSVFGKDFPENVWEKMSPDQRKMSYETVKQVQIQHQEIKQELKKHNLSSVPTHEDYQKLYKQCKNKDTDVKTAWEKATPLSRIREYIRLQQHCARNASTTEHFELTFKEWIKQDVLFEIAPANYLSLIKDKVNQRFCVEKPEQFRKEIEEMKKELNKKIITYNKTIAAYSEFNKYIAAYHDMTNKKADPREIELVKNKIMEMKKDVEFRKNNINLDQLKKDIESDKAKIESKKEDIKRSLEKCGNKDSQDNVSNMQPNVPNRMN